MPTAQVIHLDQYRPISPARRLAAARPRIVQGFVDAVEDDRVQRIKALLNQCKSESQPSPLETRLTAIEEKLNQLLTTKGAAL